MKKIENDVRKELEYAVKTYSPFTSRHETYGVLAEEVYEVLMALHANDKRQMRKELCQVAAVAMKGIKQIDDELKNKY